ncbi:hypothetical protein [Geomicrobium sp. JCM 19038]|uniref:hypothetical protein n=1 Tax=Geomicrobium sp. JCM 19038 TaxID=1460635 RepID=UPI00045F1157|nr:hypothetical protein [Geomicrobium sp. JCM 19038]GAK09023.1 hypothetical protein JCM19038_2834 [Geomicrobium sp. JCM 19038]
MKKLFLLGVSIILLTGCLSNEEESSLSNSPKEDVTSGLVSDNNNGNYSDIEVSEDCAEVYSDEECIAFSESVNNGPINEEARFQSRIGLGEPVDFSRSTGTISYDSIPIHQMFFSELGEVYIEKIGISIVNPTDDAERIGMLIPNVDNLFLSIHFEYTNHDPNLHILNTAHTRLRAYAEGQIIHEAIGETEYLNIVSFEETDVAQGNFAYSIPHERSLPPQIVIDFGNVEAEIDFEAVLDI